MNIYLEQVKEFMVTAGQPVVEIPSVMPEDRNKLRIALLFEELREYAEASGLDYYFKSLAKHSLDTKDIVDSKVDLVEQLNALCDMQYVLSGAIHENGMGEVFDDAFNEVHWSNMSKFCKTEREAIDTVKSYIAEGIQTFHKKEGEYWVVYRVSDLKVLKSINYSPANLKPFINK
jgi:predicted HAD superfamily Cof-like phosphohydrolase